MNEDETRLSAELVLRAYQTVVDRGEATPEGHRWEGLTALTDYDGYGVTLSDGSVSARVLFHNKVAVDASSGRALRQFRRRLTRLLARV